MKKAPTVTIVAHAAGPVGGQELQLHTLIRGLLTRGVHVRFIGRECAVEPHPLFSFVRVRGPARPFPLAYLWFFVAGSITVARYRIGVLQTTGAIVLNRADLSVIHFCHAAYQASPDFEPRLSQNSRLFRMNAKFAAALSLLAERVVYRPSRTATLVPVSNGVANELRQHFDFPDDGVVVIPNGVDTARFRPDLKARNEIRSAHGIDEDSLVATFVGGDWKRKGLDHAIRGLAEASDWSLIVVGPGDENSMRSLADEAGVGDRVTFTGKVVDTAPYYAAADALVFPTAYEAFPLTVLEATSSGLAIASTRVNGVEDLVREPEFGQFVQRDAGSVAAALRTFSEAPDLTRMGSRARSAAQRYSWDSVIDDYAALIAENDSGT